MYIIYRSTHKEHSTRASSVHSGNSFNGTAAHLVSGYELLLIMITTIEKKRKPWTRALKIINTTDLQLA